MATLESILVQLASRHELPNKKIGEGHFAIEVELGAKRCQAVYVMTLDEGGRSWLFLNSSIGPLEKLNCRELLQRNDAWARGPGYAHVAADEKEAFVQALLPLESCDAELCREVLLKVARLADGLEAELVGVDEA
jgi:hypothetical protein